MASKTVTTPGTKPATQIKGTMYQSRQIRLIPFIALLLFTAIAVGEGTKITPPKNGYSPSDDVQLGKEVAAQVSKELPLLPENEDADNYVERVGAILAAAIPPEFQHSEFHYDFSVVNASDINAFALPGGPMFVNRGMIEAAHNEGEMAGVMAHEISHVALRHGTAQATKSQGLGVQLGTIGGAILGAIIGGNTGDIVAQGTQLGLGTYLLKFSREYETQADLLGAQILARAGYDPMDLARMFDTIEKQGQSGGPEWMSSHPNPGNRQERISQEAGKLNVADGGRRSQSAQFSQIQSSLKRMPPARTMSEIEKSGKTNPNTNTGSRYPDDSRIQTDVEQPSNRYRTFESKGLFRISVPDNWKQFGDNTSVTFAPDGAFGNQQGESVFTHGAIIGVVDVPVNDLQKASDQYISGILQGNSYLKAEGRYQNKRLGGRDALRRRLSGTSNVTNRKEIADIYTTMLNNKQLFYIVQVVPGKAQGQYTKAFNNMVQSLTFLN
jgi:Zn-dependent protease with chaperone function